MSKTYWLMDVDQVLNDWRDRIPDEGHVRFDSGQGFDITYDPSLLDRIVGLHTSGDLEVVWLTTWCHDANECLRERFGFSEDLEVAGYEYYRAFGKPGKFWWWKLCAIDEFVAENPDARVIWADDEITERSQAEQWLVKHPEVLWFAPKVALTHEDVDRVEGFLREDV